MDAGAWMVRDGPFPTIPSSATGRPLVALGALRDGPGAEQWRAVLKHHGGDFDRPRFLGSADSLSPFPPGSRRNPRGNSEPGSPPARTGPPPGVSFWRRALFARCISRRWTSGGGPVCACCSSSPRFKSAARNASPWTWPPNSPAAGSRWPSPPWAGPRGLLFPSRRISSISSSTPRDAEARAAAVAKAAREFGADLVHGHLLSAAEARAFGRRGLPLVLTLHNMPAGWPAGIGDGGATAGGPDSRVLVRRRRTGARGRISARPCAPCGMASTRLRSSRGNHRKVCAAPGVHVSAGPMTTS